MPLEFPGMNDLQKLERRMKALEDTVERLNGDLEKSTAKIKKLGEQAERASKGVGKLANQIKGFAASLLAAGTAQAAFNTGLDRIQSNARLTALARGYNEIEQAQAAATRTAKAFNLSQTEANKQFAAIYGRLRPLGLTVEQIEDAYAGLSTAVKTASLDAAGASALFTQVSQALGSGVVQAEELNTVIDQAPSIVVALAKELDVTAGEVKKLASQGQVSSEQLYRALLRVKDEGVDVLSESLDTPAEKIKAFYNITEDIVAALTTAVIPELVDGIDDIAAALKALIPLAQVVGRVLSAAFKLAAIPAKGFGDLLANISQGNWDEVLKFDPSGFQQLGDIFAELFTPLPEVEVGVGRRDRGSSSFPTIPDRGNGSTTGGGGGGGRSDAARAAKEAQRLQEDIDKQLRSAQKLVAEQERRNELLKITDLNQKAILESEHRIYESAEKYGELIEEALSKEERMLLAKAHGLEVENERLALEEQLEQIREGAIGTLDEEIKKLEYKLAGKEEEYKWEKMIADAKAAGGDPAEVEAKVSRLRTLTEESAKVEQLKQSYEGLAKGIAGEMTGAFQSIIDGSKSAEEAMADMFKGIADKFLDMAMQILQDAIVQQLIKLIPALFGGAPAAGPMPGAFAIGQSFDGGGYTGEGVRAGGLDGKGGYLAMVHPDETVIDHRSPMARYNGGNSPSNGGGPMQINFQTQVINSVEYVTKEQAMEMSQRAADDGARRGASGGHARSMQTLLNSRSQRAKLGMS